MTGPGLLRVDDTTVVVTPSGELDVMAASSLRATLRAALETGLQVVVDLSLVTFVDTAALGVLASANRRLLTDGGGRPLVITHASARILEVLRITGLVRVLDVRTCEPPASAGGHNGAVEASPRRSPSRCGAHVNLAGPAGGSDWPQRPAAHRQFRASLPG